MSVRLSRQASSEARFWTVATAVREFGRGWQVSGANYDLHRIVLVRDVRWQVTFGLHILILRRNVAFKMSSALWPPDAGERTQRISGESGWYRLSADRLRSIGFRGKWDDSPHGRWGEFWRTFPSVTAVRRALTVVTAFEFVPFAYAPKGTRLGR